MKSADTFCPTFHGIRILVIGFLLALVSILFALPALPQTQPIVVCCGNGGGSGGGDVVGPAGSVDGELALFSGTTGKLLKRATGTGIALSTSGVFTVFSNSAGLSGALSDETGTGLSVFNDSAVLITPTIASFVNALHSHENAAGGGTLNPAAIVGTAVVNADSRLSDARTPTAHATTHASAGSDPITIAPSQVSGTAVITSDSRLSDARAPTAHASTHAAAGSDPVTLTEAQVSGLVSDLAGKQATGNYVTGATGDVAFTGPGTVTATVQPDSVALGADTTGGYAASTTEGGPATTATALAANGTNCSAGNYPLGVDASGNAEGCTAVSGGSIGGSTGANDNTLVASDGTGGATVQPRDITVSDVSSSTVTVATTAGNGLDVTATAPAASTGASQAGRPLRFVASPAVASTDTAGAAPGGSFVFTTGAAARNVSGNAVGGTFDVSLSAGIGTGVRGRLRVTGPTEHKEGFINFKDGEGGSIYLGEYYGTLVIGGANDGITNSEPSALIGGGTGLFIGSATGVAWANAATVLGGASAVAAIYKTGNSALEIGSNTGTFDSAGSITAGNLITKEASGGTETHTCSTPELVTLNTGGTTTVTSTNLATANTTVDVIKLRVTTTIATATDYSVRVTGGNNFVAIGTATTAQTALTAGSTAILRPAAFADASNAAATTLTITTTGTPSAGAMRVTVCGTRHVAPSS